MKKLTKKIPVVHGIEITLDELIVAARGNHLAIEEEIFGTGDEIVVLHGTKAINPSTVKIRIYNPELEEVFQPDEGD